MAEINAALEVLISPKTEIPSGAVVELRLPETSEVSLTEAVRKTAPKCELMGLNTPENVPCNITDNGKTITWNLLTPIAAYNPFQLKLTEGFNNPVSTEPTQTFKMAVFTDRTKVTRLDF